MALTENGGGVPATMLVGPTSGMPYYAGSQNNGFGGDGWWILLLFFLLAGGNWGNNGWNGDAGVQRGFDQASIMNGITGVNAGIGDLQLAVNNGFGNLAQQMYTNQIAELQAHNALQAQFAQCCCDNRLATAQTQSIVQSEGAATRLAIQNQTQEILDKMCQQEIDALKTQIVNLQTQVNMQNLAASQAAQTAALVADNTAQTQYIVNRVAPYPIPSYTVANPNTPATASAG